MDRGPARVSAQVAVAVVVALLSVGLACSEPKMASLQAMDSTLLAVAALEGVLWSMQYPDRPSSGCKIKSGASSFVLGRQRFGKNLLVAR